MQNENGINVLRTAHVERGAGLVVGGGGVELGEQEPRLRAVLVAVHEARVRVPLRQQLLRVVPGRNITQLEANYNAMRGGLQHK